VINQVVRKVRSYFFTIRKQAHSGGSAGLQVHNANAGFVVPSLKEESFVKFCCARERACQKLFRAAPTSGKGALARVHKARGKP
jgi:hypothetical protein